MLEVDRVLAKIRNLRYRYLPDNTLFPEELDMYDKYVIREALHNCIAHQDYALCERINVVEYPEHLLFDNAGNFIPGTIERVIEQDAPQSFYRNRFLVEATVNLDMIDTTGSGIRRMFTKQRERFFPMPDYDLSNPQHVRLRIEGRIIDRNYSQLLRDQALTLEKVIWLDKIQKRKSTVLTDKQILILRQEGLIEGRKPNYYVSLSVVKQIGQEADYARNRVLSDEEYKAMIVVYLKDKPFATRTELNDLLVKQLSDLPSIQQKLNKITNLLSASRNDGLIANESAKKTPRWILISKDFINN